jgi:hypothetical protein
MAAETNQWLIRINIPACSMELLHSGEVWREFPVTVGKAATPTPVGKFIISNKIKNPTWYPAGKLPVPPGAENPLGGYWLGLNIPSYGIHGNNNPSSIGFPYSNGCIRMQNSDLKMLVQLVGVGTPVEIIYQTVTVKTFEEKIWLTIFPDYYHKNPEQNRVIREKLEEQSLSHLIHWEALWEILGDKKMVVLEVPQKVELCLDGTEYQQPAFILAEQLYLPGELAGLWSKKSEKKYIELKEFMRAYAGQVYGVFDQQERKVNLYTLRIYCFGELFPVRGWFREEPYLPQELITFLQRKISTIDSKESSELQLSLEEEGWVPLSMVKKCWPQLTVDWEPVNWILSIR